MSEKDKRRRLTRESGDGKLQSTLERELSLPDADKGLPLRRTKPRVIRTVHEGRLGRLFKSEEESDSDS